MACLCEPSGDPSWSAVFGAGARRRKTGLLCARMCARRCRPQPRHGPGVIADEQTVLATTGPANQPTGGSSFLPSRRPWAFGASCLSTPGQRWPAPYEQETDMHPNLCAPPRSTPLLYGSVCSGHRGREPRLATARPRSRVVRRDRTVPERRARPPLPACLTWAT